MFVIHEAADNSRHEETLTMKSRVENLPIAHEALAEMVRGADWGGMTSAYMQYPAGLDFSPMLQGLERDHCQCPHWGFVIEGAIRVSYEDGTEETVGAGDIYYWPAGHTIVVEEAVRMVEFSPSDQMSQVLAHVVGKL
jgi:mannose-6-phosphate isomerase-like protein (cupin superfamily)